MLRSAVALLLPVVIGAELAGARGAHACEHKGPPAAPDELVNEADLIVRARAVQFHSGRRTGDPREQQILGPLEVVAKSMPEEMRKNAEKDSPLISLRYWGSIEMIVEEVVAGAAPVGSRLFVFGQTLRYDGKNPGPVPYRNVRPGGFSACYAYDYRVGAEYLLFLSGGRLVSKPLAAINEEVSGAGDPWLTWVKQAAAKRKKGRSAGSGASGAAGVSGASGASGAKLP